MKGDFMSTLKTRQCDICGKICNEKENGYNLFSSDVTLSIPRSDNNIYDQDENFIYPDICQQCRDGLVNAIVEYIDSRTIEER